MQWGFETTKSRGVVSSRLLRQQQRCQSNRSGWARGRCGTRERPIPFFRAEVWHPPPLQLPLRIGGTRRDGECLTGVCHLPVNGLRQIKKGSRIVAWRARAYQVAHVANRCQSAVTCECSWQSKSEGQMRQLPSFSLILTHIGPPHYTSSITQLYLHYRTISVNRNTLPSTANPLSASRTQHTCKLDATCRYCDVV